MLAIRFLISNSALSSVSGLLFTTTAQGTKLEAIANGAMKFLSTNLVFSVAKGAPLESARCCLFDACL
jgi:hypothetical protein